MAMDINEILKVLPHRYPFLLVDRVLEVEPGQRAVGIKNVTMNEPHFAGHWPENPVMPGVLLLEAMAQVAGVALLCQEEFRGRLPFFGGMDKVRFRKAVRPGDQVVIEAIMLRRLGNVGKAEIKARVEGEVVCEGVFAFAVVDGDTAAETGGGD